MLSLYVGASSKELNRALKNSRVCFPLWGAKNKPAMRPASAPTSNVFMSPSPQKISDLGLPCQPNNYPRFPTWKTVFLRYSEIYLGRGIHEYLVSERGFRIRSGLIPLPLSLYSGCDPLTTPKRGISLLSISSIRYHGAEKKRKTKHNLL
jgi:hypothetical protein